MTDNPWAAWLREQDGAQVLPDGAAAGAADDEGAGPRDEFRGGPFGWDLGPEPPRPRRHLLLAAAALWVLILLAALAAIARPATPTPTATVAPAAAAAEAEAEMSGEALPVPAAVADGAADGPGGLLAAPAAGGGVGEAGALLVRAALSAPSGTDSEAGPARYVDATVVTGVEAAGEAQVVSVLALVLSGDGQGWKTAAVEGYAVAVVVDPRGSYRSVAGPWALAPPAVPAARTQTSEADPERLALAGQALETAGYRDIAELTLLRDAAYPGVLTARARAVGPGAAEPADWTLWLRDTDAPTVLGSG